MMEKSNMILETLKKIFTTIMIYRFLQILSAFIACFAVLLIFQIFTFLSHSSFDLIVSCPISDLDFCKLNIWQIGQLIVEVFFMIYLVLVTLMTLKDLFIFKRSSPSEE